MFVVFKFNKRILDALQFLATKITIKNIYVPYWNGKIPAFAWRSYAKLKRTITENNGKMFSISYKKQLYKDENINLTIMPVATNAISYYDATYQPLSMEGMINKETFIL